MNIYVGMIGLEQESFQRTSTGDMLSSIYDLLLHRILHVCFHSRLVQHDRFIEMVDMNVDISFEFIELLRFFNLKLSV